ncbi:Transmembrane 6 superfamily member 2 [Pichia kudriavzevii]|uniref:Transmembrane 6 superfamily member 2 n=1 Tax=Pichia kudriavzevii TaxID=4909 RepID=A0A1V2LL96_PICKU|nr:Transmembrane 6 superfamily member 2 [Pichia kudriavzevii]
MEELNREPMSLVDVSTNLVAVCDFIIKNQHENLTKGNQNEYSKNGKKYKMTSRGNFIRVQDEDKHLVLSESYEDFKYNYSILSCYHILKQCGNLLKDYRQLALAIIFTSREIELNKWHDDTSKVSSPENANYEIFSNEDESLNYISDIDSNTRSHLILLGTMILTATKINFFQTDHNVTSPSLEGYALKRIMSENFGEQSLTSLDIALIKKSLVTISNSIYGHFIKVPENLKVKDLLKLCQDIENDPLKYHIRSSSLMITTNQSLEVSKLFPNSSQWIEFVSCVLQAIGNYRLHHENKLLISNKILKVHKIKDKPVYKNTLQLVNKIKEMERSNPDISDEKIIQLLGGSVTNSISQICKM